MAPKRNKGNKFTVRMQRKLLIVFGVVALLLIAVSIRLIRINVSRGYEYSKAVYDNFNYDSRTIPARRGDITDRNGTLLAYSTKVYNLILDAKVLLSDEKYREPTVNALLTYFNLDGGELNAFIDDNAAKKENGETVSSYRRLILALQKDDIEAFNKAKAEKNSNINGVWFEEEYKRTYPFGSLACDLIGFASEINGGELGIEKMYNEILAGTDGRLFGYINDSSYEPNMRNASNGNTVVTTIDYTIQNIVEQAVSSFNEVIPTKGTAVIVMDPNNGEILAMCDYPSFDLNKPRDMSGIYSEEDLKDISDKELVEKMFKVWNNSCVSWIYEPGSVFKTFTVAEAIDEKLADLKDVYTCDGEGVYNSAVIQCHGGEGHGDLTLAQVLSESCNDAIMQIGMDIGPRKFTDYLAIYKFGAKTGIDLPSEENGLLINRDMMDVDLVTNAFGQNLNVTMVQMAANFASIINGGYYYQPHVLKAVYSESGDTVKRVDPLLVTQTVSSNTSSLMREMLRTVVEYGTGSFAYIDGYSIGGKTGTAEKSDRDKSEYVVSFMGFAPAEKPEILVYVVVDSPYCLLYDSSWAAQLICRNIFKNLLPYMAIMPDAGDYTENIYMDSEDFEEIATRPTGPFVPEEFFDPNFFTGSPEDATTAEHGTDETEHGTDETEDENGGENNGENSGENNSENNGENSGESSGENNGENGGENVTVPADGANTGETPAEQPAAPDNPEPAAPENSLEGETAAE